MPQDTFPLYPNPNEAMTKDNYGNNPLPAQSATGVSSPVVLLGPENCVTTCPFCQASIKTAVRHTITSRTHLTALLCTLLCCCCCIPYCMESTKNSDHYCPACQKYLGTYEK
ncbi:lipopolysaccharide-induced tumor necrosis factor-alpha factor homolog [Hyposmocoma kahamanoa]|uniref:lipopolysaccharide-induced tumor necrosis factor-alpha factor homolog n=1 Tax=Hyposmocoma kahamanoa TaxID=1477025 RepID=UPI000E6D8F11|nr:lipopolysaccharide-induced tumor necrosis factor-alpha factor homolog [Hyposmocoma kahamanoa]